MSCFCPVTLYCSKRDYPGFNSLSELNRKLWLEEKIMPECFRLDIRDMWTVDTLYNEHPSAIRVYEDYKEKQARRRRIK